MVYDAQLLPRVVAGFPAPGSNTQPSVSKVSMLTGTSRMHRLIHICMSNRLLSSEKNIQIEIFSIYHKNKTHLLFVYFKTLTKYDLFCVASLNEDHFNIFSCSSNHVYLNNLNHYSLGSSKSLYSFILRNFSHIRATTRNWRKQFLLQLQCRAKILWDITNITDLVFEV